MALTTDTATSNLAESLASIELLSNESFADANQSVEGPYRTRNSLHEVSSSEDIDTDFKCKYLKEATIGNTNVPHVSTENVDDSNQTSQPHQQKQNKQKQKQKFKVESHSEVMIYDNENSSNHSIDFRMGGLGRSRGRKATFSASRIRGLYDDPDVVEGSNDDDDDDDTNNNTLILNQQPKSIQKSRRAGKVIFQPRHDAGEGGGWLCYVVDDIDLIKRACALRTVLVRCH